MNISVITTALTVLALTLFGLYPNIGHGTTFNQGSGHIDITPQGGVAVSDNGGKAVTLLHQIIV